MAQTRPTALTVAGSDPSGGAGIQADIKVLHQHGLFARAVATVHTVQDDAGVSSVQHLDADQVGECVRAALRGAGVVKTGALGSAETIGVVIEALGDFRGSLVVDPVFAPTSGPAFSDASAVAALAPLIERATVFTPNADEAGQLLGASVEDIEGAKNAAVALRALGPHAVLLKGGHVPGPTVIDVWATDGGVELIEVERDKPCRGTGCALSSAIAANLGLGRSPTEAVMAAKSWLKGAIATAPRSTARPPVNFWYPVDPKR